MNSPLASFPFSPSNFSPPITMHEDSPLAMPSTYTTLSSDNTSYYVSITDDYDLSFQSAQLLTQCIALLIRLTSCTVHSATIPLCRSLTIGYLSIATVTIFTLTTLT